MKWLLPFVWIAPILETIFAIAAVNVVLPCPLAPSVQMGSPRCVFPVFGDVGKPEFATEKSVISFLLIGIIILLRVSA